MRKSHFTFLSATIILMFAAVTNPLPARARTASDDIRALLGQIDKSTATLESDLAMDIYWKSFGVYKARHRELVDGLRRDPNFIKNASWRSRTKSALSALQRDARGLTNFKAAKTSRTAALRAQLGLVAKQTNYHVASYRAMMANFNSTNVNRSLANHNKLVQYMNVANRERRKLDATSAAKTTTPRPKQAPINNSSRAKFSPAQAENIIASRSRNVVMALKQNNPALVAVYAHPDWSVRFMPYPSRDSGKLAFQRPQLRTLASDSKTYNWGNFSDESDEP